jgi:hypothetical protein
MRNMEYEYISIQTPREHTGVYEAGRKDITKFRKCSEAALSLFVFVPTCQRMRK